MVNEGCGAAAAACSQRASVRLRQTDQGVRAQSPGPARLGSRRAEEASEGERAPGWKRSDTSRGNRKCIGSDINDTAADSGWISAQEAEQFIRCDGGNPSTHQQLLQPRPSGHLSIIRNTRLCHGCRRMFASSLRDVCVPAAPLPPLLIP